MSKELEALERIYKSATGYAIVHKKNDIKFLRKALTPPTEQEVCEALSEYLGNTISADENVAMLVDEDGYVICGINNSDNIYINEELPPHLIMLIGKFYESEVKNNE